MSRLASDLYIGHPERDTWEADEAATEKRWRDRLRVSDSEVEDNIRLMRAQREQRERGIS